MGLRPVDSLLQFRRVHADFAGRDLRAIERGEVGGVILAQPPQKRVYVVGQVPPSWSLSAALVLSMFGSNWAYLGLPKSIPADRIARALP